jgi:L-arabinose isomerase
MDKGCIGMERLAKSAKFVRFGDNMRYVAVTDGDKVEAELKFGYSVNTYGIGDLAGVINSVKETSITKLCDECGTVQINAFFKKRE